MNSSQILERSVDRPLKVYHRKKIKTGHQQAIQLDIQDSMQPKMGRKGAAKESREDSVQRNMERQDIWEDSSTLQ